MLNEKKWLVQTTVVAYMPAALPEHFDPPRRASVIKVGVELFPPVHLSCSLLILFLNFTKRTKMRNKKK